MKSIVKTSLVIVYLFLSISIVQAQTKHTFSGYVKENGSAELLPGASIAVPALKTGTMSNGYGFFSITLPADTYTVYISYVGYQVKRYAIDLRNGDIEISVPMEERKSLQEVVVRADREQQRISNKMQMSSIEIPIQQIKEVPMLMGEKDVLKTLQLLPGVQKPSEGQAGIYVRGGGPDQNLIILDDAIVYNAFHLFGFFSLFNGDALKSVELIKGGFPARYGGRLSSVIDMRMKEGNKTKFGGEVGIGAISSRIVLEGPIIKNKSSFIVSGRRTYLDALISPFIPSGQSFGYYFYDFNAKANYEFNEKNKLFVSAYLGRDKFFAENSEGASSSKFGLGWGNKTATIRWNHQFTPQLFGNASLIYSDYDFTTRIDASYKVDTNSSNFLLQYSSGITDYAGKYDFDYRPSTTHTMRFGAQFISHTFTPSAFTVNLSSNNFSEGSIKSTHINSQESGIYWEDEIRVNSQFRISPGLRYSFFKTSEASYQRPEPRLAALYQINGTVSVKGSYAEMNQYVHLLSNSGAGFPSDLWVPSGKTVKPQFSRQFAAGIAKDIPEHNLTCSIEGYYKEMDKIIAFKEGASFLLDNNPFQQANSSSNANSWENNVTAGKGKSYGFELFIQRKTGKLTGWIGYTLSWTTMQFDSLNFGKEFWAKYDRRHDFSIVAMYEVRQESQHANGVNIAATWVYGTGNAITLPLSSYDAPMVSGGPAASIFNTTVSQYTGRNQYRMNPYHRLDVSIRIHKKLPKTTRTWEISVYNAYNRRNPYFLYVGENTAGTKYVLNQVSLFPIIPSVTYQIKF